MPENLGTRDSSQPEMGLGMMEIPPGQTEFPQDKVFFALLPDAAAAERIAMLARLLRNQYGMRGRVRLPTFHVSLYPVLPVFGQTIDEVVSRAVRAVSTIIAAPFEVAFDRVLSFRSHGDAPLVLASHGDGQTGPIGLMRAIEQAMINAGLGLPLRSSMTPHLTMLYDRKSVDQAILHRPFGWMANEFVLVRSLFGRGRYQHLGRWPLRG